MAWDVGKHVYNVDLQMSTAHMCCIDALSSLGANYTTSTSIALTRKQQEVVSQRMYVGKQRTTTHDAMMSGALRNAGKSKNHH